MLQHATTRTEAGLIAETDVRVGAKRGRSWPRVLRGAVTQARENDVTTTAQALAYSFFLAIPALFLVALGVFSLVANPGDIERLMQRFARVMPPEAATLLGDSLQRTAQSQGTGLTMVIVGFVLALRTTTSAATTLMKAVTGAFGRDDDRTFVRKRLLALVLVACFLGAALLVVGLLVCGPFLQRWVGN